MLFVCRFVSCFCVVICVVFLWVLCSDIVMFLGWFMVVVFVIVLFALHCVFAYMVGVWDVGFWVRLGDFRLKVFIGWGAWVCGLL